LFDDASEVQGILLRFWARAIKTASLAFQRHFTEYFTAYIGAVTDEAVDRDQGHCRNLHNHFKHRRNASGAYPAMALSEMAMDLPDEVFYHPVITELAECIADMIAVDNVKSY